MRELHVVPSPKKLLLGTPEVYRPGIAFGSISTLPMSESQRKRAGTAKNKRQRIGFA